MKDFPKLVKIHAMRLFFIQCILFCVLLNNVSFGQTIIMDKFSKPNNWKYISDDVMGGVSKGELKFFTVDDHAVAFLSGKVSTENNGGFIQIRRKFQYNQLKELSKIKVIAKGNNERYFLHIRTKKTILPWHYYQISFDVSKVYSEKILLLNNFVKSSALLPKKIKPNDINSIGIVAFGKNHDVELYIKKIEFMK